MKKSLWLAALFATPCLSQDLTHPTDMGLPASDFARPDPAAYRVALDNGLVAYVAEADRVPLVTLSAFIRAGTVSDDRPGAAEALRDALRNSGPAGASGRAFRSGLEQMAAAFDVEMHDEWTEVTLNVPAEDLDRALAVFAALLREPAIGPENLQHSAANAATAAAGRGGESGAALYEGSMDLAVERFHEILYRDHPFGQRPAAADFDKLRPADVRAFHAKYFVPGNMTLAVAGAIDRDDMEGRIAEHFGHWEAADVPEVERMPAVTRSKAAMHYFPSSKLQSWIVIGHDLPPVPLAEQAALDVLNYILGAYHLNTRLMRETRYRYGYTNDASAFLEDRWYGPGSYTFRSYSRPDVIENVYRNMLGEIRRIRDEEVSDRELFVAKGALAEGEFQVRYRDGYALTRSFALERLRYGHHDRSASYVQRIRAVSKQDVLDVARKYLHTANLQTVLLGESAFEID